MELSVQMNVGKKLKNAKYARQMQNQNIKTYQTFSPYTGVFYNFVLKSVKSVNRIFWAMEY